MSSHRQALYRGGASVVSRNSSIFMKSVFSVPLYRRNGGLVPGAKSFSSSGFLDNTGWSRAEGV